MPSSTASAARLLPRPMPRQWLHRRSTYEEWVSASPIGRIAPGRYQERHVEMAFGVADRKTQRNLTQKRRVRHRHLPFRKVAADTEQQFVPADRNRPAGNQRLIG